MGLMILGVVVGVLIVLWFLVYVVGGQLSAGGLLLGLIPVALLSLSLIGAGWYLRGRGAVEQVEAATFSARRAVIDNDRVVRRELARELEQRASALVQQVAVLPAPAGAAVRQAADTLQELLQDVRRPGYDTTTWLEQTSGPGGPRLDRQVVDQLQRYDRLVLEEVRRLETLSRDLDRQPQGVTRLSEGVDLLVGHVREREALLGRGELSTGLSAQELLAAGRAPRRRLATHLALRLEDAVTYELEDYVVRGILTYFAGSRQWRVYQLHDGKQERWLQVRGEGVDVVWFELRATTSVPAGESVTFEGAPFASQETGSASVDVESSAGRRAGVFVEFRNYRSADGRRLTVETWPDAGRVLFGKDIQADELDLWTKPPTTE